ncbi:MAG TPA: hypothetical protein VFE58_07185 [Tepidisphaeraceae bacterium]|nr:hypothetical protein [Tepidisphaeraceae bacterium]
MKQRGRVFILESPNPLDLLENRSERYALEQVCKLVGHDAATFVLRDRAEFLQTCNYISSIYGNKNDKRPLFIHISVHGNSDCLGIGRDSISWDDLTNAVQDMYQSLRFYHGPIILILSACEANKQELTGKLAASVKTGIDKWVPPEFVFVFVEDKISWQEAVVTWTIFYHEATKLDFTDRSTVQTLLTRLG